MKFFYNIFFIFLICSSKLNYGSDLKTLMLGLANATKIGDAASSAQFAVQLFRDFKQTVHIPIDCSAYHADFVVKYSAEVQKLLGDKCRFFVYSSEGVDKISFIEIDAKKKVKKKNKRSYKDALNAELYKAVLKGNIENVKKLILSGANRNEEVKYRTPLMNAIVKCDNVIFEFLIKLENIHVNKQNQRGLTALHYCVGPCSSEHIEVRKYMLLQLLLKHATINAVTNRGYTALHVAAAHGNAWAVEMLCMAGADKTAVTNDRETALDLAKQFSHKEVVSLLS